MLILRERGGKEKIILSFDCQTVPTNDPITVPTNDPTVPTNDPIELRAPLNC